MNDLIAPESEEVSLFALGALLVQARMRIARWAAVGGIVAGLSVIGQPHMYRASVSIAPQSSSDSRSGLTGLAGQLGLAIPGASTTGSPDFYAALLKSKALLWRVVTDTLIVAEEGSRRVAFLDLFEITESDPAKRAEYGVKALADMVDQNVLKTTGVVQVSLQTEWPSVSQGILLKLVEGVDDYNRRTRQSQAAAERQFLEGRLAMAREELQDTENRLSEFLRTNRQFANSSQLTFAHDRLQREVSLRQQVVASLTQSYEDARIREVRDTPVITIVEPAMLPRLPEPRGRIKKVLLGLALGGMLGMVIIFVGRVVDRERASGNPEALAFFDQISKATRDLVSWIPSKTRPL